MKSILIATVLMFTSIAFANYVPFTLLGKTSAGDICSLTVEEWSYTQPGQESWETMVLVVRSGWQKSENPSVELRKSATPWAHYGINKETYDQFAVNFATGDLTPGGIQNYLFQTWSEETGLVQEYCRFNF